MFHDPIVIRNICTLWLLYEDEIGKLSARWCVFVDLRPTLSISAIMERTYCICLLSFLHFTYPVPTWCWLLWKSVTDYNWKKNIQLSVEHNENTFASCSLHSYVKIWYDCMCLCAVEHVTYITLLEYKPYKKGNISHNACHECIHSAQRENLNKTKVFTLHTYIQWHTRRIFFFLIGGYLNEKTKFSVKKSNLLLTK